ncbi:hypothetical protein TPHA_0J01980 [Tetrapisispora phaffii CBS 4417]|uniref:Uncharacterized protein n=1 Tax=Tetrapisispora phaffii (strain ATCC 24235 / CBS 4417 / NBRC 1672 / NRRL Y-8282 / UCD 70-5) TaxID=1071381 RepID=G8BYS7_TETPH|nr:hypothetical protein TPHA_0J01980 [Tetrapisispora phaffii CBS 4417]CCE65019.1 hypothetical protein TPHA_0J01980 [Tetrapisispora phaffii CBS 4417]
MGICASKSDQGLSTNTKPVQTVSARNNKTVVNKKVTKPVSSGSKLSDANTDSNQKNISPQEAARLAAQKRFDDNIEKETKTELGKKLASERSKSQKTHVMEQIEKQQLENNNKPLVYD